jgi:hypothetical protein
MKALAVILVLGILAVAASVYVYFHTTIRPTEPCRKTPSGEVVCPPAYRP